MYNPHFYQKLAKGNFKVFKKYYTSFYPSTYIAIARLSDITDTTILVELTESVFLYLWDNRHLFVETDLIGALPFKTTLSVVLLSLKTINNWDRINHLRQIIHCNEPFLLLKNKNYE
jgi:hypothetical protein